MVVFRTVEMREAQALRIAVYERPSLDKVSAAWLARRFFTENASSETFFVPKSGPLSGEDSVWRTEPGADSESRFGRRRSNPSFAERYAASATGYTWTRLLSLGRPVAHLVDLVDAIHYIASSEGDPSTSVVCSSVGFDVSAAWETAPKSLHTWLDGYEAGLGIDRVRPVSLERVVSHLPEEQGTYAMILKTVAPGPLLIGRTGALGRMEVRPGYYVYSGSACQFGGMRGRWRHHLTPARKLALKWQVDFLRLRCAVVEVWYTIDPFSADVDLKLARSTRECALAMSVLALQGATVPVRGFGSPEDLRCPAYLAHFERKPTFRAFQTAVARSEWPCHLHRVAIK